jgi:hypothetical protein
LRVGIDQHRGALAGTLQRNGQMGCNGSFAAAAFLGGDYNRTHLLKSSLADLDISVFP